MSESPSPDGQISLEDAFGAAMLQEGLTDEDFGKVEAPDKDEKPESEPPADGRGERTGAEAKSAPEDKTPVAPRRKEKGAKAGAKEQVAAPAEEPEAEVDAEPVQPPMYWNKEEQKVFQELPKNVQRIIAEKNKTGQALYTKALNELQSRYPHYMELEKIFTPERQQHLKLIGQSPATATARLWEWQEYLQKDPAAAVSALARTYNLAPEDILRAYQGAPAPAESGADERVAALEQELEQMRSQTEIGQLQAQINQFAMEKDQNGNLLRPYFEELKPRIGSLFQTIHNENPGMSDYEALHHAWEQAAYAHPGIRARMLQQQGLSPQVSDVERRAQEQKELAKKTRLENLSIKGSAAPTQPPKQSRTIDEAFEMAAAHHGITL